MENAARQTLEHPMTFEIFGERLRWVEGWALRDLANFRKRCRDKLVTCFESFLRLGKFGQSPFNILACFDQRNIFQRAPQWLVQLFKNRLVELRDACSKPFFNPRSIRREYLSALNAHTSSSICVSCVKVHAQKGEAFCKELEDRLTKALDEVCTSSILLKICSCLSTHLS